MGIYRIEQRANQMTHRELVNKYLPRADDGVAMFVLWEMTPYPCWDPTPELERLARICAPVRKRGWFRKLMAESHRIYAEIDVLAEQVEREYDEQRDSRTLEAPPSPDAVDPAGGIVAEVQRA